MSEDIIYPHVWVDLESARGGIKLIERLKFTILEIQENLDNFTDKKDFALECLDAIKTHQKLVSLGKRKMLLKSRNRSYCNFQFYEKNIKLSFFPREINK